MSAAQTIEVDRPLSDYVAEEVRALMARRRVRQQDLAEALQIGQSQISARLNGRLDFTLNELGVVAEFFETTPAALMGAVASRIPVGQLAADEETPDRSAPGGGSMFVLPDFNDLRACRDSNPKPSDLYPPTTTLGRPLTLVIGQRDTRLEPDPETTTPPERTARGVVVPLTARTRSRNAATATGRLATVHTFGRREVSA